MTQDRFNEIVSDINNWEPKTKVENDMKEYANDLIAIWTELSNNNLITCDK